MTWNFGVNNNWRKRSVSISIMQWDRYVRRFPIRPWNFFFDSKEFSLPEKDKILLRLEQNIEYFLTNYVLTGLALILYCLVTNIYFAVCLLIVCLLWLYLLFVRDPDQNLNFKLIGINLSLHARQFQFSCGMATVILLSAFSQLILLVWFILVAAHAVCRKRAFGKKASLFAGKVAGSPSVVGSVAGQIMTELDDDPVVIEFNREQHKQAMDAAKARHQKTRDDMKA
ncbi:Rab acceptor 1, partial [Planoprotostelium fungivorum]